MSKRRNKHRKIQPQPVPQVVQPIVPKETEQDPLIYIGFFLLMLATSSLFVYSLFSGAFILTLVIFLITIQSGFLAEKILPRHEIAKFQKEFIISYLVLLFGWLFLFSSL